MHLRLVSPSSYYPSRFRNAEFMYATLCSAGAMDDVSNFVQVSALVSAVSASRTIYSQILYQDKDNIIAAGVSVL